jgi:hypothetical protein
MLRFVPLDTPIAKVISLQVRGQSSFMLAATISAVLLVFLGTEMALGVCGFASFHLHNDKLYRGQPLGLIHISSADGLFLLWQNFFCSW